MCEVIWRKRRKYCSSFGIRLKRAMNRFLPARLVLLCWNESRNIDQRRRVVYRLRNAECGLKDDESRGSRLSSNPQSEIRIPQSVRLSYPAGSSYPRRLEPMSKTHHEQVIEILRVEA